MSPPFSARTHTHTIILAPLNTRPLPHTSLPDPSYVLPLPLGFGFGRVCPFLSAGFWICSSKLFCRQDQSKKIGGMCVLVCVCVCVCAFACVGVYMCISYVYSDLVGYLTSDIRHHTFMDHHYPNHKPTSPIPPCGVVHPPPMEDAPPVWPFASPSSPPPTHECFLASGSMENDSENTPFLVLCVCV